jgi:K+-transporting ATPase ATPase B chain
LRKGDLVIVKAAEFIPGDGESLKARRRWTNPPLLANPPVVREAAATAPSPAAHGVVGRDQIRITSNPGETFSTE